MRGLTVDVVSEPVTPAVADTDVDEDILVSDVAVVAPDVAGVEATSVVVVELTPVVLVDGIQPDNDVMTSPKAIAEAGPVIRSHVKRTRESTLTTVDL